MYPSKFLIAITVKLSLSVGIVVNLLLIFCATEINIEIRKYVRDLDDPLILSDRPFADSGIILRRINLYLAISISFTRSIHLKCLGSSSSENCGITAIGIHEFLSDTPHTITPGASFK